MRKNRSILIVEVMGLVIGVLIAFPLSCAMKSDSGNNTAVTLSISRQSQSEGQNISSPLIDPSLQVAALVVISAPDLQPPLQYIFTPEETRSSSGILTIMAPNGNARTIDVKAFIFDPPSPDIFPGKVYVPTSPPSARTVDLNGRPIVLNIDLNQSATTVLTGVISDARTASFRPLEMCANPKTSMSFTYLYPPFQAGTIPVTVLTGGLYSVSNVPDIESFTIGLTDSSTGAGAIQPLAAAGPYSLNFDLIGASPLSISPTITSVQALGFLQFTASGGLIPRHFALTTNFSGGAVGPDGLYLAGIPTPFPDMDVVTVTDDCTASSYPEYSTATAEVTVNTGTAFGIAGRVSGWGVGGMPNGLLADIHIEPGSASNPTPQNLTTNPDGTFFMTGIVPGYYYLSASAPGYVTEWYFDIPSEFSSTYFDLSSPTTLIVLPDLITLNRTQCNDSLDNDGDTLIDMTDTGCVSISDTTEASSSVACDDGIDNDTDGLSDMQDTGCMGPLDTAETDAVFACDDGADNDGDTLIDLADPGCEHNPIRNNERSPNTGYVCDDGLDNDLDTLTDYPADTQCASATADLENPPGSVNICTNSIDDDGDTLIDGADPSCSQTPMNNEKSMAYTCDNGVDNDGDTLVDFPADPGCLSPSDSAETASSIICNDGIDNDSDGYTDFPSDPGCADINDPTETTPLIQCDNGIDDDGDTLIDYPPDQGCYGPLDPTETNPDIQCQDGLDNDGDMLIDELDPECSGHPSCTDELMGNDQSCGGT